MKTNDLVFNLETINNLHERARKLVAGEVVKFIKNTWQIHKDYPHFYPLTGLLFNWDDFEDKPTNNQIIDGPDYYLLPCGRYLEDYIAYCGLEFAMGSALKYAWRAGKKYGESAEKDWKKARHYIEAIAKRQGETFSTIELTVEKLRRGAETWDGKELAA